MIVFESTGNDTFLEVWSAFEALRKMPIFDKEGKWPFLSGSGSTRGACDNAREGLGDSAGGLAGGLAGR